VSIRQTQADGNCFFRALSDQICGSEEGHAVLRALVIDFLSARRETFELLIDLEHFSSWENFIWKMGQHGTFVDGNVVTGTTMLLRRQIIIHQDGQRPILFKSLFPISNNNQIHLVYDSKHLHYNSLWSIKSNRLHLDESECVFT
jgi:OTU domain-containing protein 3